MNNHFLKNKLLLTLLTLGSLFTSFSCSSSSITNTKAQNISLIKTDSLEKPEKQILKIKQVATTKNYQKDNSKAEAERLYKLGKQQMDTGQFVQGTENLEKAMRIYQEIGEKEKYKEILQEVYLIYLTRGAYDKLEPLLPEFTAINAEEAEEEGEEIECELDCQVEQLIFQGNLLIREQNYTEARSYFEQALSRAKEINGNIEQGAALTEIGKSYLYEGNYTNALVSFKSAESLSAERYKILEKKAASSGDIEAYGDSYREIIHRRIPILLLLGETYLQQDNASQALFYFEQAAVIATKVDTDRNYSQFGSSLFLLFEDPNLYLSRANYSLGNYKKALEYAQKAIEKGEKLQKQPHNNQSFYILEIGDLGDGQGYALAGVALEKLGKLEQAEQQLKKAVQRFETIRKNSKQKANIETSVTYLENQIRAASWLQRVLFAQNKSEEALTIAELGKGRLLVEAATTLKEATLEEKVDAMFEAEFASKDICQEMEKLYTAPEANIPEGMEDIFITERIRKEAIANCDSEAYLEKIKQEFLERARKNPESLDELFPFSSGLSSTGVAPSNIKPPSIKQLKQIAQSHNTTIVEYSIVSDNTFFDGGSLLEKRNIFPEKGEKLLIWVIQPTGDIQFHQINLKEKNIAIENLVASNRQTMGLGRSPKIVPKPGAEVPIGNARIPLLEEAKEQLKELHELLIEPIADLLPTDPEANVVFVPHKELFLVPFAALIDSENKYLIEKHTITTAPSIQALDVTRQKQQRINKSQKALVVGNPTMPFISQSSNPAPEQLSNLPGAEVEGQKVAQLLNTQFLTGDRATETEVVKQLSDAQYVHLATHGLLDDYAGFGFPGAVALAPTNKDDGFLSASEIQELNLTAELAVLSACDTGRGDITGDGVIGLSRAFIVAGVPSVVVSLWSVPDAPTADLMVEFYRNFTERKLDKAQALRQAMLTAMKTNPNPVDWAAFTLIGEAE